MPLRFVHADDLHRDEDHSFADTAQCLEWFVADAVQSSVDLFVINGDLTTHKATIKERNVWVDRLVEMASHAPVILPRNRLRRHRIGNEKSPTRQLAHLGPVRIPAGKGVIRLMWWVGLLSTDIGKPLATRQE